ncbi:MAG: hypothetical protein ABIQ02_01515 [Saprospiraceae bacterium]
MRTIPLFLLFIIIANTIGGICLLYLHHYRIHAYIETIIRDKSPEPLDVIIVPHDDSGEIIWLKSGLEFRFHGDLYDIVCMDTKNDTAFYYCINDQKEEKIINEFANNVNQPFPGQHQDCSIVFRFFKIISDIIMTHSAPVIGNSRNKLKGEFTWLQASYPVYFSVSVEPPDII